jgi:hypothetical protein
MAKKDARRHEIENEPIPRHILEDPKVQAAIEDALERVRRGDTSPGSTPEQLTALADEERRRLRLDDRRRL